MFCDSIFLKSRLRAYFLSLRTAALRKLAGKLELGSISPQELSKTF